MRLQKFRLDDGPHSLHAAVTLCGRDVNVQVCGGQRHHIGAVALGVPRPSLADPAKTSASVSVLCVTGHKDDEFARMAAAALAARLNRLVSVGVGIHIDGAKAEDLSRLRGNFTRLTEAIAANLARAE